MHWQNTEHRNKQSGFTMMEVLIATIVLIIGLIGVAQLVPMSIGLNTANRQDSTSLVIAQREMDAMIDQPISATTFTDPQGIVCGVAAVCSLGNPATPNIVVGSPFLMRGGRPVIDYTQATVAGYSYTCADPNDPGIPSYDIRWAVITLTNGAGRRIIVGVRKVGSTPFLPVTLDSMVEK